ncbi:MAG: NPCBM/NEW2 domain-containing protein [Planctomycetota bacterium]
MTGHSKTIVAALFAALALTGFARGDEVVLLSGNRTVNIERIHPGPSGLTVVTNAGTFGADQVREFRFEGGRRPRRVGSTRVFLRNGDEITGTLIEADEEQVAIESATLGKVVAGFDTVRAVLFTDDREVVDRFRHEVLKKDPLDDFVVLPSWDRREGLLESVGPGGVGIELTGLGSISIATDKAIGLRIAPLEAATAAQGQARLALRCNSALTVQGVRFAEDTLTCDTAFAKGVTVPRAFLTSIEPTSGRFQYLSDLRAGETETRSQLIDLVLAPRFDGAVQGGELSLAGRRYRKGVGLKAYTRLAYDLGGGYESFRAVIGLDDSARARLEIEGTVTFRVLVDGKPHLGGAKGLLMTSQDAPRPINIPLAGAKRLELIADFGPSGDVLARGAFADAFLVKAP